MLRNIGHSMSMVLDTNKLYIGNQQRLRFYIRFIMTLYYNMRQALLQNSTTILLQNATKRFIAKCVWCFITKCNSVITTCDSYYKMWHCTINEVFIKDFFSKCNQIRNFLRIWSHLLNKSFMENFIFCEVNGLLNSAVLFRKCGKINEKEWDALSTKFIQN